MTAPHTLVSDALWALSEHVGAEFGRAANMPASGIAVDTDIDVNDIANLGSTARPHSFEFPVRLFIWQTVTGGRASARARYELMRAVEEREAAAISAIAADRTLGGAVSSCVPESKQYRTAVTEENALITEAAITLRIKRW